MIGGILYAIVGIIEAILGLRFLFGLIGANPASSFVETVYNLSGPLVAPFSGILGQDSSVLNAPGAVTQSVFEWSTLVALIVYGLIGGIVARIATGARR